MLPGASAQHGQAAGIGPETRLLKHLQDGERVATGGAESAEAVAVADVCVRHQHRRRGQLAGRVPQAAVVQLRQFLRHTTQLQQDHPTSMGTHAPCESISHQDKFLSMPIARRLYMHKQSTLRT